MSNVILEILVVIILLGILGYFYYSLNNSYGNQLNNTVQTTAQPTTTINQGNLNGNLTLDNYMLSLINKDRQNSGLPNVTLAQSMLSAQQHAQSMLYYGYFSHWDPYGMKPYMRYTLLGEKEGVDENVAFEYSSACSVLFCSGNVDVYGALQKMEYSMVYNDSVCCNNGHRNNILDPKHNEVSIGIAYNKSTIYLTQDFIDDYISWQGSTPSFSSGRTVLSGMTNGYKLSSITISYDPPVTSMTRAQLDNTSAYEFGTQVAGVVNNSAYYYKGIQTIVADRYSTNGNNFYVSFDMSNLIHNLGAGEYTVALWLTSSNANASFVGSSYTIFIDQNGNQYSPQNI